MRKNLIFAGIAAASLIPSLAMAQVTCEERSSNRAAGTAVGAVAGALLGSAVAGHGDKGTGAVIGGGGGAVIGNQLSRGPRDCAHAYGYYDNDNRWHDNHVDRSVAYGYYDRSGVWVDGTPPNVSGYGVNTSYESRQNTLSVVSRIARIDNRIQRGREGGELAAHGGLLVGEDILRIEVVDDHRHVDLEDQQASVRQLGAVDAEVVEADAAVQRLEGGGVAHREVGVEVRHPGGLLGAALRPVGHLGAEVVHHPVLRDREVAGVGLAANEGDPLLAEECVAARIVDEGRDIEARFRAIGEIGGDLPRAVELLHALPRMGADRAGDQRPGQTRLQVGRLHRAPGERDEGGAVDAPGHRRAPRRLVRQQCGGAVSGQAGDPRGVAVQDPAARQQPRAVVEHRTVLGRLAHRQERDVMGRRMAEVGGLRIDEAEVEL